MKYFSHPSAEDMYQRDFIPPKWYDSYYDAIVLEYKKLKEDWQFDPKPDSRWNSPEKKTTTSMFTGQARTVIFGNCNDFAPALRDRIAKYVGIPHNAMRLRIGTAPDGTPHMVLVILFEGKTLIACNLAGVWDGWDKAWKNYDWLAQETAAPSWKMFQPTLEDLWASKK